MAAMVFAQGCLHFGKCWVWRLWASPCPMCLTETSRVLPSHLRFCNSSLLICGGASVCTILRTAFLINFILLIIVSPLHYSLHQYLLTTKPPLFFGLSPWYLI